MTPRPVIACVVYVCVPMCESIRVVCSTRRGCLTIARSSVDATCGLNVSFAFLMVVVVWHAAAVGDIVDVERRRSVDFRKMQLGAMPANRFLLV